MSCCSFAGVDIEKVLIVMSKTNVGANLMFARRTKTGIKPMFENEFETA